MYNMTNKLDKEHWYYNSLNCPYSTFATFNEDVQRLRRGALSKFFSLTSISKIEPMIADRLKTLPIHRRASPRKEARRFELCIEGPHC
jgi:hypothetical protein